MGRFQSIEHTADAGIEVEGKTIADLFKTAGEAFCDIVCDRSKVQTTIEKRLSLRRNNREELLQGFLSELLYRFDAEHEIYSSIAIDEINEGHMTAVVKGEKIDRKRHKIRTGIKAVTFHQLRIWQEGKSWKARVIFDV